MWAQLGSNQRPPDYERQMRVSTGLHRFVSVCTSLFCNRIIVKDYTDLYRYGGNTGTKTGTNFNNHTLENHKMILFRNVNTTIHPKNALKILIKILK